MSSTRRKKYNNHCGTYHLTVIFHVEKCSAYHSRSWISNTAHLFIKHSGAIVEREYFEVHCKQKDEHLEKCQGERFDLKKMNNET